MDDGFIRKLIESLAGRAHQEQFGRMVATCWPGGPADRNDPVAKQWLRRWRPGTAGAPLPVCTCAAGHCAVCN